MSDATKRPGRFFQFLLRLLPGDFRGDFGPEMEEVFSEQRAEAERRKGKVGVARLWWETIAGIFTTAPREHLSMLRQDSGYAVRMMRKNWGFTLAAVLTLALGIGANTAIFSVVRGVVLKPLPYANGDRLVLFLGQAPRAGFTNVPFSIPEIQDFRSQSQALDGVVEYHNMSFILLGKQEPEQVVTGVVSPEFFDLFGVQPLLGRNFRADDDRPGAPAVLLLSYNYWMKGFGGDPTVVGRAFTMNDRIHTVVGVLPPLPRYPNENDVYMPSSACPFRSAPAMVSDRGGRMLRAFGRIRPGATVAQARADLNRVLQGMVKAYPANYPSGPDYGVSVTPLRDELSQNARPAMLVLLAATGFVLLIACANVASLNLARMVRREREFAVRAAMGAGRVRLFRQLLTESLLLGLGGAALGLLLAAGSLQLLTTFVARFTPRASEIALDGTVLVYAVAIAIAASLLSGSAPAFSGQSELGGALKEGGRATPGARRGRARSALTVAQIAVSFLLLIGAGLTLRSLVNLLRVQPGFDPENVLTMQVDLNWSKYNNDQKRRAFFEEVLEKAEAQPGVRSAAVTMVFPLGASHSMRGDFLIEGRPAEAGQPRPVADFRIVSPRYLETLRIPVLAGRGFAPADRADAMPVAIVNQSLARHQWGNESPVGKRVSFDDGRAWAMIVGVVGDVKQYGLDREATDEMYIPLAQNPLLGGNLVVKTAGEPMALARTLVQSIYAIDPHQPAARIRSLEEVRADSVAAPRLTAHLLALFALVALAIAAAGISGVMALSVSQRTHEIGVRMAIGARPGDILRMVLGQGMTLAVLGIVLGGAAAFLLTRIMMGLLFNVAPTDPLTYAGVALVLVAAAFAACYAPARRAERVDPVVALRAE